jgi:type I restriction enzyme M protein
MLGGVVSMPSNIFATTTTNVSILFIDSANKSDVTLIDASGLGQKVKDGKNLKTLLTPEDESRIVDTFTAKSAVDDFSVAVSYDEIAAKEFSFIAGQYLEIKVEHVTITPKQFAKELTARNQRLNDLFSKSRELEKSASTTCRCHCQNRRSKRQLQSC